LKPLKRNWTKTGRSHIHLVNRAFMGLDDICTSHEEFGGEREDIAKSAREVISMLSEQKVSPVSGRNLNNRNLPSVHKISRLLLEDDRFTVTYHCRNRLFHISQENSRHARAATDIFIGWDNISVTGRGEADEKRTKNTKIGDANNERSR